MKRYGSASSLLLAACLAVASSAQGFDIEQDYTGRYYQCMNASGGVTVNMLNCIADGMATQDARLNGAYSKARSELSEQRRDALLNAQRRWIEYRDANCGFYATAAGTIAQVISNECYLRETIHRAGPSAATPPTSWIPLNAKPPASPSAGRISRT